MRNIGEGVVEWVDGWKSGVGGRGDEEEERGGEGRRVWLGRRGRKVGTWVVGYGM